MPRLTPIGPQKIIIQVTRGGETKSVRIHESMGESPVEMVIITGRIENVMRKITWEKVSDARPPV